MKAFDVVTMDNFQPTQVEIEIPVYTVPTWVKWLIALVSVGLVYGFIRAIWFEDKYNKSESQRAELQKKLDEYSQT